MVLQKRRSHVHLSLNCRRRQISEEEVVTALAKGWMAVDPDADVFVAGEMGIGNTSKLIALC